jgi:hypothetical protein
MFKVEIKGSAPNNPALEARFDDQVGLAANTPGWGLSGTLFLRNLSGYSANNPAVIIRLDHMVFRPSSAWRREEWVLIQYDENRLTRAIQWDGGPAYSIHGKSTRRLPDFPLGFLWYTGEGGSMPMMTVEILAEGYKKEKSLSVDFIVEGQSQFPRQDRKINPGWI